MSKLSLNASAYIRLQAQVNLSGTFNHTLHSCDGCQSVAARVEIDQCNAGITVLVQICGTLNSVTLDKHRKNNATRIASFIEGIANGRSTTGVPDVDEHEAVSDIEATLRLAIRRGRGIYHLIADELEPSLQIQRNPRGGYIATLELDDAGYLFTLPADNQRAHTILAEYLNQFLQGYRNSLAAAA
ncbi:hypothetical protein RJC98_11630 [Pseudomonas allii]|jgi:hypothetical protein|uniref:Uncharacterized protein n=2 Tax=Pseudomonas TaxID=286 RepID=A0A2T4FIT9_9PSED|nr:MULTISPECIES: hypothetical protein [Pseudomonas]MDR9875836.1 hypothetical protein [Pseudomonas allii]OCW30267.1 hypothetical protein BBG20_01795 [Pseudomonas aylmerensis]PTC23322.1 hypothetical protein C9382_31350 [Pseudomonas aylmerensis]